MSEKNNILLFSVSELRFAFFPYFLKHLKIWLARRHIITKEERGFSSAASLVKCPHLSAMAQTKPKTRNSSRDSYMGGGDPSNWAIICVNPEYCWKNQSGSLAVMATSKHGNPDISCKSEGPKANTFLQSQMAQEADTISALSPLGCLPLLSKQR